jgi:t-SNARE complex subunit (syntaxin)
MTDVRQVALEARRELREADKALREAESERAQRQYDGLRQQLGEQQFRQLLAGSP